MNTMIIITGYGSIKPTPWRKAYLNLPEKDAAQRFAIDYPQARDVSVARIVFDDEMSISANGSFSSSYLTGPSI